MGCAHNRVAICHRVRYNAEVALCCTRENGPWRPATRTTARLNFRLPAEVKTTIEEAAACLGQSVSDFAVSVLAQTARNVLEQRQVTRLSKRDRDAFVAILDAADAQPNKRRRRPPKGTRTVPESPLHWDVQRLAGSHDRDGFDCGVPPLDEWLKKLAGQFDRRDLARTYVAVEKERQKVLGYYALSNHQVSFDALPKDQAKGLPTIDIPVALLGQLAVDRRMQAQGLGAYLLIDALRCAEHISRQIGIRAVEVHAINDAARRFYLKYGFAPLGDDHRHLFMSMPAIRKLALPPF